MLTRNIYKYEYYLYGCGILCARLLDKMPGWVINVVINLDFTAHLAEVTIDTSDSAESFGLPHTSWT